MSFKLHLDSIVGRSVEIFLVFLLNAKINTLLHFKRFRWTPKKSGCIIINTGTKYRNRTTLRPR